jgi:acetyl esterase/lipase
VKKLLAVLAAGSLTLAACAGTVDSAPTESPTGLQSTQVIDPCNKQFLEDNNITVTGAKPGDVLYFGEPVVGGNKNEPATFGIRQQRIVYVSTLRDTNDLVPVCGSIYTLDTVQPSNDPNKVLMWTHGTVGLKEKCQPSTAKNFSLTQAPNSGGLGSALPDFLVQGYTVIAPDYYAGLSDVAVQPYANGPAQARNALDMVRAVFPGGANFSVWGHSQGGGAALWVGQLATTYLPGQFDINAVVAAAPASQLTTGPKNPNYIGEHLGDRQAYNFPYRAVPLGPVLFSFVLGPWKELSSGGKGGDLAAGPALTSGSDGLRLADALTADGVVTVGQLSEFCLNLIKDLEQDGPLLKVLEKYTDFGGQAKPYFAEPFQGNFKKFAPGSGKSAIDQTCVMGDADNPGVTDWCNWLTWNNPGPYGTSNMPKYALNRAGQHVPTFVAQGLADNVVWCMAATPSGTALPSADNCLATQLVKSIREGDPRSKVQYSWYEGADHFAVMVRSLDESKNFILKNS